MGRVRQILVFVVCIQFGNCAFITRHPGKACTKEWTLVFRGVAGNSRGIYSKWRTRSPASCYISNGCIPKGTNYNLLHGSGKKHLRSQLVDEWTKLNIKEVKLCLYKNGQEVAYLKFNGKSSSYTSWFTYSRLIETSWFDLFSDGVFNIFSMSGSYGKTFMINQDYSYGSCSSNRRGWFEIVDKSLSSSYSCSWERARTFPQFYYGLRNHKARFYYGSYGYADTMGIFIKRA